MTARFWISVGVIFVALMLLGFVAHGFLLGDEYAALPNLFRQPPEANAYWPWMLLAHVFFAASFVWIYLQGRDDKPYVMQGVRYGIAVAALVAVPMYLIYYSVQPTPGSLALQQIIYDSVSMIILGVIVAWLNRDAGHIA